MADRKEDASLGVLCQSAYLANGLASLLAPDIQLSPKWAIRGYLTAEDELCGIGENVYYGFLAESKASPGEFVVAIRGTAKPIEWVEDGEFLLKPHPLAGHVEAGFYDLYKRLRFNGTPVVAGILAIVGKGLVTVVGHSLGAALATYLTLDLAGASVGFVRGRFIASPHPGDAAFAAYFDAQVADYVVYAYELDAVPRTPVGLGYVHLPKIDWLSPKNAAARIRFDLGCSHSLSSYIAMLDYTLSATAALLSPTCADCVKGALLIPPTVHA